MSVEQMVASSVTRAAWVDRLRVAVIAGVVVAHTATAYLVDIGWYYEERTNSEMTRNVLMLPMILVALYGLAPLFVVAGWMSQLSLARHGRGQFIRARLVRLGIPVLVYGLFLDPVADYVGSRAEGEQRTLWSYLTDPGGDRDVGPMWFVAALLVFSLVFAALSGLKVGRLVPSPTPRVGLLAGLAVVIAGIDFATWLGSRYTADTLWGANWAHWPQSAGMFALGVVAARQGWVGAVPRHLATWCGRVGLAGLLALVILIGSVGAAEGVETVNGGWHWAPAVFAILDGATAVTVSVWVLSWFQRRFAAPLHGVAVLAARASYATYILHPLVLVALSAAARPLPWPPEGKFVLVAVFGVPACFAVGHLAGKVPGVSGVV